MVINMKTKKILIIIKYKSDTGQIVSIICNITIYRLRVFYIHTHTFCRPFFFHHLYFLLLHSHNNNFLLFLIQQRKKYINELQWIKLIGRQKEYELYILAQKSNLVLWARIKYECDAKRDHLVVFSSLQWKCLKGLYIRIWRLKMSFFVWQTGSNFVFFSRSVLCGNIIS